MEVKMVRSPSNRDKRTTRPKFIVGGVEGLLLLGGSLAIAGLVALFTIKTTTSRRRKSEEEEEEVDHNNKVIIEDKISKETTCFDDGSENIGGIKVVLDQEGHDDIELVQGGAHGGSNGNLHEEKGVLEADKEDQEDEEQPQHEIFLLSDDSTPPESVSLDEEKGEEEQEGYEEEEDLNYDYGSSEFAAEEDDDEEEEEMIEEALPVYLKEFSVIDPNYESIAKEQNSFNCLEHKFETSSSAMFGSRQHLPPPPPPPPPASVVQNHLASSVHPLPLTKAQVWLVVPVVLLTMLLALIHFFVVDNYVIDMQF